MPGRIVVVGGGAAGMSAASAARRTAPDLEVVVLESSGYVAYGLCGLPYYLSGVVPAAEDLIAYPVAKFTASRGIDVRLHARATALDPQARTVTYEQDGEQHVLDYTAAVIAAGARPVQVPLAGLPAERVHYVRTLEEAIELRALLDSGEVKRALVVGAGYIGLEVAEALVAKGASVTVVERLDQVLPNLDREPAAVVQAHVESHVDLRLGTDAAEVDLADVDIAVVSVGVRPASTIAAEAGAKVGPLGALLVDDDMRTSLEGVWAAGDCVAPRHRVTGEPAFVPLGTTANKTGRVAGIAAAGGEATFAGIVGTAVVKVFDLEVARTGLTLREAQAAGLDAMAIDITHRTRAKYYPGGAPLHVRLVHGVDGRVLGAQMVGEEGASKRIDIVATALHAGMSVADLADLDLAYAPPYSPVYDPVLIAAQTALRGTEQ